MKLLGLPGVSLLPKAGGLRYFHLLCDAHEVILAEGAPTESLLLGPQALELMPEPARQEIEALFPGLIAAGHGAAAARLIPAGRRQARMIARHAKNRMPVLRDFRPAPGAAAGRESHGCRR